MKSILALLAATSLSTCAAEPAFAANQPVSALAPRGAVVATDQIPVLPLGATTLQATTIGAIAAFGGVSPSINGYAGVDPTGVTDSTVSIQTVLSGGQSFTCDGVYKVSSTLNITTTANHGQILTGSGSADSLGGTMTGRCTFRPTAALIGPVFRIDGTSFDGYIQSLIINNVTVDMSNMSDVVNNIAFQQIQAYDIQYDNVRVINYGLYKTSWQFLSGSYTTILTHIQGGLIDFKGASFTDENTTVTLVNSDIVGFQHDYFEGVSFIGGAIQRGYSTAVPVVYLAPGVTPQGFTANTAGLYAGVLSQLNDSQNFTTAGTDFEYSGGFTNTPGCGTGQYNDGIHGCLIFVPVIEVQSTAVNTSFINPSFSGVYELDLGNSTTTLGANAGGGAALDLFNVSTWFTGYQTGVINGAVFSGWSDRATTTTFTLNSATGAGGFETIKIEPASNGANTLTVYNAAGASVFNVASSTGEAAVSNGGTISLYTDNEITQIVQLSSSSGAGRLSLSNPDAPINNITLNSANGTIVGASLYNTPVGNLQASTGAFTTLSASSTVSGYGFSSYLASPPAIGGTSPAAGNFTSVSAGGKLIISASAPLYSSGFSAGTPIIAGSTTAAFTVMLGSTPGAAGALSMPGAAIGWACSGVDRTTAAGTIRETATATNSVSFALVGTVAGDVLQFQCTGN